MSVLARPPAVAGTFYPADSEVLAAEVDAFVGAVEPASGPVPKAIVVPHAGYVYSGPVAAHAYAALAPARDRIRRVVLLGPAHRAHVASMAVSGADVLLTPLGAVPVDRAGRDALLELGGVAVDDAAHAPEHSLEVQLPFLQRVLAEFSVLPVLVGAAAPATVGAALDALWGGTETLIVVSSDLSHYLDHATATTRDRRTAETVLHGDWKALDSSDACGAAPLRGLLVAAQHHGLDVELLALCNSGDTAGPPDRVVGYGAFALS